MADDRKHTVHVSSSKVRKDLIGYDDQDRCARCHGELESGFGMAGGGFGVYDYCPVCEEVVSKTVVED